MPTVMITGASRGLGFEFARQYSVDGWKVIATCRSSNSFKNLSEKFGVEKTSLQKSTSFRQKPESSLNTNVQIEILDIADPGSIAALVDKLKDEAIDVLINNAGIVSGISNITAWNQYDSSQMLGTLNAVAWNKIMHVNSISPIMVTESFLPNIRRGKNQKIVMLSSRYGSISSMFDFDPEFIAYCASKAALNMAMRVVANTLKPENIVVASLNPGWVKTDMGGAEADITPEASVSGMRKVIEGLTMQQTGQFFRYNGESVAW